MYDVKSGGNDFVKIYYYYYYYFDREYKAIKKNI